MKSISYCYDHIAERFCPQHKEKKYFDMLLMMFTSPWANETLWGEEFFSKQFLKLEDTKLINKMEKETMGARKTFVSPQ